jgi:phosphoribosylamine---glycine ligase
MRWPGRLRAARALRSRLRAGQRRHGPNARCVPVDLNDLDAMVRLAEAEQPDLTIVGPELPLSLGIVDAPPERGLRVFGPTRAAAMLESSKGFAKQFLQRHNIPTPNYAVCSNAAEVEKAIEMFHPPIVVKADGLFAGKGVIICPRATPLPKPRRVCSPARCWARPKQPGRHRGVPRGRRDQLPGAQRRQARDAAGPAQDHKRIGEGDTGPNTGGMGVYSTDTLLDPAMSEWILRHIAEPTIDGMAAEGSLHRRALLRADDDRARPAGARIQCRFGDPETQAILVRLESDLGRRARSLRRRPPRRDPAALVSGRLGLRGGQLRRLSGQLQNRPAHHRPRRRGRRFPASQVFHAGTALKNGQMLTAGGRVLGVTAAADSLAKALARAYQAMAEILLKACIIGATSDTAH